MKFIKKWAFRLSVFLLLSIVGAFVLGCQLEEKEYMEVEVKPGDSVWSIASEWSSKGEYQTTAMVNWIVENNYIWDNVIHPGDTLIIPVEKEEIQLASKN